jgi:hypothetical protein
MPLPFVAGGDGRRRQPGRPGGIRTPNFRFWRPALYQLELLACVPAPTRRPGRDSTGPYFFLSLCGVCARHCLQNLRSSSFACFFELFVVR